MRRFNHIIVIAIYLYIFNIISAGHAAMCYYTVVACNQPRHISTQRYNLGPRHSDLYSTAVCYWPGAGNNVFKQWMAGHCQLDPGRNFAAVEWRAHAYYSVDFVSVTVNQVRSIQPTQAVRYNVDLARNVQQTIAHFNQVVFEGLVAVVFEEHRVWVIQV